MTQICPELTDIQPRDNRQRSPEDIGQCSGVFSVQVFLDLFYFLLERLILHGGTFAPRLAFGFWLGSVCGDLATINFLVTLLLALKFGAQFIFRHSYYLSYEALLRVRSVNQAVTAPEGDNCRDNSLRCYGYKWAYEVQFSSWPCGAGRLTAFAGRVAQRKLKHLTFRL